MKLTDLHLLQPVGLASVPGVGRAAPSLLGTRPVLQAAHRGLIAICMSEQFPRSAKERSDAGTDVGIART